MTTLKLKDFYFHYSEALLHIRKTDLPTSYWPDADLYYTQS